MFVANHCLPHLYAHSPLRLCSEATAAAGAEGEAAPGAQQLHVETPDHALTPACAAPSAVFEQPPTRATSRILDQPGELQTACISAKRRGRAAPRPSWYRVRYTPKGEKPFLGRLGRIGGRAGFTLSSELRANAQVSLRSRVIPGRGSGSGGGRPGGVGTPPPAPSSTTLVVGTAEA